MYVITLTMNRVTTVLAVTTDRQDAIEFVQNDVNQNNLGVKGGWSVSFDGNDRWRLVTEGGAFVVERVDFLDDAKSSESEREEAAE